MTVLTIAVSTHVEQDVGSLLQDCVGGRLCDCAVIEVIPGPCVCKKESIDKGGRRAHTVI